jgi:hypothetical protein
MSYRHHCVRAIFRHARKTKKDAYIIRATRGEGTADEKKKRVEHRDTEGTR